MAPSLTVLAHHSEPTDSELLEWLTHTLDAILGQSPIIIVVAIGVVVIAFPLTLAILARRRRQSGP